MPDLPVLSLVLGARTAGFLVRAERRAAWAGVAARPAIRLDLPMGIGVEGGFAYAPAQPRPDVERWAASVRLTMPLGPEAAVRPLAAYGWEYSSLTTDDRPTRAFATTYGLGFGVALGPALTLQPSTQLRFDSHVDGGACPTDPACLARSLWEDGRVTGVVQLDLVVRLAELPRNKDTP